MKIFKSSKLLALVLAISLCLGAMSTMAFAADDSAPAAEAAKPEIISQNVKYGGNFSLMFAVDASTCSGETVTLKVYNESPTATSKAIWSKTVSADEELKVVHGTPCYVFITAGVAAKDLDVNYYVVAESAGVKSDVKEYSVAEYLYERLYGDGIYSAPDAIGKAQADLYKSVLEMGKNAQELLFNHDDNPDNDRTTFVTDLYYVATAIGNGGAYGTINGKGSGYLTDGSEALKIISSKDTAYLPLSWNVKYIDKDGNITVARDVDLTSFTPTSHMIITPAKIAAAPSAYTMDSVSTISTSYIKAGSTNTVVSLGEYNGSKGAVITLTHNGGYYEFFNGPTKTETGATKIIYDTDITLPVPDEDNIADGYAKYRFEFTSNKKVNGTSYKATTLYVDVFENGTQRVYDTKNGYKTVASGTLNVRIEYYEASVNGETKMVCDTYINGELYGTVVSDYVYTADGEIANGVNNITWMSIVPPTALNTTTPVYQDNLVFAKVAPVTTIFADTLDDPGAHAIDGWTSIPKSFADGSTSSIVEYNNSSAIKFDMSSSSSEKINFYTQSAEAGADLFVFEADISDFHPVRTKICLYDKNGKEFYNFTLNGRGGLTAESNSISWKNFSYPQGETFKIRIEVGIKNDKLDINIYANDILAPQPSNYGAGVVNGNIVFSLDPVSIEGISKITFVDDQNDSSSPDGYIIFDNIKMEAIKTTK